ncbi:MAG: NAD(+)/NADH kinase [Clostridia bacterium]|nr:NAD(+)/NADH kinase [Clostridia bacterium]
MRVGVYQNIRHKEEMRDYIGTIFTTLESHGIECVDVKEIDVVKSLDVLLVLGGDGTILTVAAECALHGVKILGINCGHMGFLTDFEGDQITEALKVICRGHFNTVKRSMLKIEYGGKEYYALNEAVIQRCTTGNAFSNTINLHAEIDGSTVDNFSSDGLIISTPTGSTAYSLSAGGSILTPDIQAFIITPICPHSLHSRPIVFSDSSTVQINQMEKNCKLNLIVDGRVVETIKGFDVITIKKADRYTEFISVSGNNFFDKLLIKLNIWSK